MSAKSMPELPLGLSLVQAAESLPQGLLVTDETGRILFVNDAFCRTTGYSLDETIGQNPRMLQSGRQSPEFYRRMWNSIRRTGHWDGEIVNRRKDGRLYTEWLTVSAVRDPLGRTTHYIGIFRDFTHRRRAIDATRWRADHDVLTGLANRTLFQAHVDQAIARARRSGAKLAVVFLDVDHFKETNDALGHEAGDHLLREIAMRLRRTLREEDILSRYGGDEFVAALPDVASPTHANWVAEKMAEAVRRPLRIAGASLSPTLSIGISLFPDDARDADTLLRSADAAMYLAKREGRNQIRLYQPSATPS